MLVRSIALAGAVFASTAAPPPVLALDATPPAAAAKVYTAPPTTQRQSTIRAPRSRPVTAPRQPTTAAGRIGSRTAQQATGAAGSAAARSVYTAVGGGTLGSLASSAVRNTVSELQRWWRTPSKAEATE